MIDERTRQPWPSEVRRAAERFRQGHLIERPPLFYQSNSRYWLCADSKPVEGDDPEEDVLIDIPCEGCPPYGIITSQTCDINEQGAEPRRPWVEVAPVYRLDESRYNPSTPGNIRGNRYVYWVALTSPDLGEGLWVADLRIKIPLEKSFLVDKNPIESFAEEHGYRLFARRLANQYARPALANALVEHVVNPLKVVLGRARPQNIQSLQDVRQLRLAAGPSFLNPDFARLIVITSLELPSKDPLRTRFDNWWTQVRPECETQGITLLDNRYTTLEALSAADYEASEELVFEDLSPAS